MALSHSLIQHSISTLADSGLKKTGEMKYSGGTSQFTLSLPDGTPLFKYYVGGTQENALYCHEKSPLADQGSYIKFNNNKIIHGRLAFTEQVKHELESKLK